MTAGLRSRRVPLRPRASASRFTFFDLAAGVVGAVILSVILWALFRSTGRQAEVVLLSPPELYIVAGGLIAGLAAVAVTVGRRGGPVSLDEPTVFTVLLAPVDRRAVLRRLALRQAAIAAASGAVAASVLALTARPYVEEISVVGSAIAAAAGGLGFVGVALVAGARGRRWPLAAVGVALAGWWAADLVLGFVTSPVAALARLATNGPNVALVSYSAVVAAAALFGGIVRLSSFSVEAAWRRSGSTSQLRVALALNDFRTALLIVRRRSHLGPRGAPWIRLSTTHRGDPVVRRAWHSALRWPLARVARFTALPAVAGAMLLGVGSAPALWLPVLAIGWTAGMDAADSLAEEFDHPDLLRMYPTRPGRLIIRHLVVAGTLMVAFGLVTDATLAALGAGRGVVALAIALTGPAALAAIAGAALTASRTARPFALTRELWLPPEVLVPRILLRTAFPALPMAATIVAPVVALTGGASLSSALVQCIPGLVLSFAVLAWVVYHDQLVRSAAVVLARLPIPRR